MDVTTAEPDEGSQTAGHLPHIAKLRAAKENPILTPGDMILMDEAIVHYQNWRTSLGQIASGEPADVVAEAVNLTNAYKDVLEIDLVMSRGSPAFVRQRGQMKIDNSVMEEFLIHLFGRFDWARDLENGPRASLLGFTFDGRGAQIQTKNQDHVLGHPMDFQFATGASFSKKGRVVVPRVATEVKTNLDKTMFNEARSTASSMKSACPSSRYFILAEYLDMAEPDDQGAVDNVFVVRRAKRLGPDKRNDIDAVRLHRETYPLSTDVIAAYVEAVQKVIASPSVQANSLLAHGMFR